MKLRRAVARLAWCGLALLFLALPASAQQLRPSEYRLIRQQPVTTGEHIEVIDFFWYGCPYCSDMMADWAVKHGIDRQKWLAAYESPEVDRKIERAK